MTNGNLPKLRIGIVGAGRMGITHYSIINSNPKVDIVAVADTSKLVLSLMNKYLKGVKTFTDYKDLMKLDTLDAILVCTPPNLHFPIIQEAGRKGIHVFSEKPFTTDYNEAKQLTELYESLQLVNQVGYVNRFNDVFLKVKEFVSQGVIGEIIRFKSEMFSCTISRPDKGSGWRATRENGGGAVFEMAAHAIDLVNFLIGAPDKIIGSSLNKIYSKYVEDAVSSTFLYNDGKSGTIYINWSDESYRKPTNKIEIFGSKGKIVADQHSLKVYLKVSNEEYKLRNGWNTLYITDIFKPVQFYVRGNEFTRQLYHFIDCIEGKEKVNHCTFRDGFNTINVINEIFNDYEKNGRI